MENLEHVLKALNACIGSQVRELKSKDDRITELWKELTQAEAEIERLKQTKKTK
jgi:peptidoglycan hydrolase CwlO-like protein